MTSSEVVFYELLRVLLESFSKQEYTLFFEKHRGEQTNCSRPQRWRGHGWSFQLLIAARSPILFRHHPIREFSYAIRVFADSLIVFLNTIKRKTFPHVSKTL